jgi:cyclic pyranopterin monophosphate synthase
VCLRALSLALQGRECQFTFRAALKRSVRIPKRAPGRDSVDLSAMSDRSLTRLDPFGGARVTEVAPKEATHRRALARCRVMMAPETTAKVASNAITKGDVLGAARIAGIQAAKRTPDLIPMCHPLLVGAVHVNFTFGDDFVEVEAQVETIDRTGVEMEALTACVVAALTIYDMCKSSDRSMSVGELALWEKTGGSSGHWRRPG